MTSAAALLFDRSGGSASGGITPRRTHNNSPRRSPAPNTGLGFRPAIHRLITSHLDEGHLLPRQLAEIAVHASRFVIVMDEGEIVGCADLAPLSHTVAEIRSLIVGAPMRSNGVGRRLIEALIARARVAGFERLCAFTHAPSYFVRLGFSLVPHEWLPEKVRTDCVSCALFRTCGQYAVMLRLHD